MQIQRHDSHRLNTRLTKSLVVFLYAYLRRNQADNNEKQKSCQREQCATIFSLLLKYMIWIIVILKKLIP